jgi:hypothetical protein
MEVGAGSIAMRISPLYRHQPKLSEQSKLVKIEMCGNEFVVAEGVNLHDRYAHVTAGGWDLAVRDLQRAGVDALEGNFDTSPVIGCKDVADGTPVVW